MGGEEEDFLQAQPDNHIGLSTDEAIIRLEKYGRNELAEKSTPGWVIFARCLWGPMPIALWIAIVIEFALENYPDAGILLAIQFGNATIGWYETTKAGDAVAALRQSLKPSATVFRDGQWQEIDAGVIVPGDKVKLASGSAVPADCTINDEPQALMTPQIDVDESALTGESLPVTMMPKTHLVKMGCTVVRGEVDGTVQFTGTSTVFGKTALLLQAVEADLGNIHYVLVKVMYGLTGLSMLLCTICFIFLMTYHHTSFKAAIEFTVVLLIVSIPIAIEIVVTTTLALGSKELSAKKVIVTRLSAIEMMAGVDMLCSDKTGTLTLNKMEIQQDCPIFTQGEDRESVLVYSALAAKWREPPRDALDTMVLKSANLNRCDKYKQLDYKPFDPRVKRTEATLLGPDGVQFKVTKGAPNIVLQLCANSSEIKSRVEGIIDDLGSRGVRCLAVARTFENEEWYMLGILTFLDPPRPDTKVTIENAKKYGVDVKMVTGDHVLIAKEMARMLNMGTNIQTAQGLPHFPESGDPKDIPDTLGEEYGDMIAAMDGFAQVHPEHKYLIVETLRQRGFTCAMTGDGVNDAPALKRADVGIAVHGSTDAARAASDMVLTEPGLSVIVDAMLIARGVFQRMLSFLTYRVSATLQLVFFFFIAVFSMNPSGYATTSGGFATPAFFNLPVLMFMLITLLNDGTLMAIGYDNVVPQPRPQRWNLPALFFTSAVLAAVACVSSLLLLWLCLDSMHRPEGSWFAAIGLSPATYPHTVTAVYLKVSISDFLTLFTARTHEKPFYAFAPSGVLLIAASLSLLISTLVATFWVPQEFDGIPVAGLARSLPGGQELNTTSRLMPLWVWLYCIFWLLVQDAGKVLAYHAIERFDLFHYRSMADIATRPCRTGRPPRTGLSTSRIEDVEMPMLSKGQSGHAAGYGTL
jgi:H+-transporting ATPase